MVSTTHSFTFSLREATLTMPCACPNINRQVYPKNVSLIDQLNLVCTSFRLVLHKLTFTNQPKKTPFPDQLNLVCTSFRLVLHKLTFTNQPKKTPFTNQINLVCTSFRLVLPYVQVSDLYTEKQTSPTKKNKPSPTS